MTSVKQQFEQAASDVLRELELIEPELLERIIHEFMKERRLTRDEAIRLLAEFETMMKQMLEVSQRIGEA